MKITNIALSFLVLAEQASARDLRGKSKRSQDNKTCYKRDYGPSGTDNGVRLLLREGLIDEIPSTLCSDKPGKNVFLVVGDGMGWEMIRAGAITKRVLDELEKMGVNTSTGADTDELAEKAKAAFKGRTLDDYYTEGPGSGLSWQTLDGYKLVTTGSPLIGEPNKGAHYASPQSMLEGSVADHDDGMAPLRLDERGLPLDFDPRDYDEDCGNMVLWSDKKGGMYPWDKNYYTEKPDTSKGFDPEYIMRHATDSAPTAGNLATGEKAAGNMLSVNLYEDPMTSITEMAMRCEKAAGVVTSVPVLHATPGAFVTHSNYRKNGPQMQFGFKQVNPTFASGVCASYYQPSEEHKQQMIDGSLSNQWTFLSNKPGQDRKDFYDPIQKLDPDDDQHVMVCLGGDYVSKHPTEGQGKQNLPYRGIDSNYSNRHCSYGLKTLDPDSGAPVGVVPNSTICDHYTAEEIATIPHIATNVEEAVKFLSKDDDGFFLMYEQGDIDWAAHANHMDDMLGTMLDINDSVEVILDWIKKNGGWEKNALYVTADHDHYLTLNDHFPEALAHFIINGETYKMTPSNNSNQNPWTLGTEAGKHEDKSKTVTEHLNDYSTWTDEDIEQVGHFWGPRGSGGNGWGSHSNRPVPLSYMGDDGCLNQLTGKGYQVLGRDVEGSPGKVDQVHIHACMMKNLFGL